MLSLILHPDDNIRPRVLSPAELTYPGNVLEVANPNVIYLEASVAMWVDEDYLNRPREEFNAGATFLVRDADFLMPSLRGPALLCALRENTFDNFTPYAAVRLRHRISDLLNS